MEENLLLTPTDYKLYKDKAIYIGTFIGGPLVAGYLIAENFKKLGQYDKVKTTWIITIISTIIIFGAAFLIPAVEKLPGYIIPIAYTLIVQYLVKTYQGKAIEEHLEQDGKTYSIWRAVGISLIGLAITFAVAFIIAFITNGSLFQ